MPRCALVSMDHLASSPPLGLSDARLPLEVQYEILNIILTYPDFKTTAQCVLVCRLWFEHCVAKHYSRFLLRSPKPLDRLKERAASVTKRFVSSVDISTDDENPVTTALILQLSKHLPNITSLIVSPTILGTSSTSRNIFYKHPEVSRRLRGLFTSFTCLENLSLGSYNFDDSSDLLSILYGLPSLVEFKGRNLTWNRSSLRRSPKGLCGIQSLSLVSCTDPLPILMVWASPSIPVRASTVGVNYAGLDYIQIRNAIQTFQHIYARWDSLRKFGDLSFRRLYDEQEDRPLVVVCDATRNLAIDLHCKHLDLYAGLWQIQSVVVHCPDIWGPKSLVVEITPLGGLGSLRLDTFDISFHGHLVQSKDDSSAMSRVHGMFDQRIHQVLGPPSVFHPPILFYDLHGTIGIPLDEQTAFEIPGPISDLEVRSSVVRPRDQSPVDTVHVHTVEPMQIRQIMAEVFMFVSENTCNNTIRTSTKNTLFLLGLLHIGGANWQAILSLAPPVSSNYPASQGLQLSI